MAEDKVEPELSRPDFGFIIAPGNTYEMWVISKGPTQEDKADAINRLIKGSRVDTNLISDGYHTIKQLYGHRIALFLLACRIIEITNYLGRGQVWRSQLHHDGTRFEGWFIMGINTEPGKQVTYHLPMVNWHDARFAITLDRAPEWDGHTSDEVETRLYQI